MTVPKNVVWVREDVVLAVHLRQLAEHGGDEGLRDEGLLQSALARPQNLLTYSDPPPDLAGLAAAYAYSIARNHPFIDGNKRMALIVARLFLLLNGTDLVATQEEKYSTFLALAAGQLSEGDVANWVRAHLASAAARTPS
ncbi:MAG TPA: type II toxin-antitoxin system death-on-curing family toxin [Pyrinomonadaceae bacterium]|nr:type II toxin-antitoxin system death-on-curing family toxin [Pyrinomonadaceae bacterium]